MGNKIDEILETTFTKLKTMADTDTIIGKSIKTDDGTIIIPVSKVTMGFVAGGGEYSEVTLAGKKKTENEYPFAGGTGAGMTVNPVAFIVISATGIEVFGVDPKTPSQKLFDLLPEIARSSLEKFGILSQKKSDNGENDENN